VKALSRVQIELKEQENPFKEKTIYKNERRK
jgi:hypothetical protein